MTGEENGVPNPKNLTAAARRILPRPFGARVGRGRVPWTPGGTRKGAATLDAILHRGHRGRVSVRWTEPNLTTSFPKREGKRDEKGSGFRVAGEVQSLSPCEFSPFHRRFSSPRRTDSTVGGEVALSAMLVCHGPPWRDDDRLLQSANNCQLRASPFRVGSSPQSHHQPPTSNTGPGPEARARLSARLPTFKTTRGGGVSPRLAVSATPSVRRFWRSGGGGAPLVRLPPSPPTPFGARTGRRRCKPPASPHVGGFAVNKT